MTVTQRIGWDPLARQFRSWEFDSEGGFGEGRWSRDGDRWVVKHTGVRPEGTTASATNIMIRGSVPTWSGGSRPTGSSAASPCPTTRSYVLVRVPPTAARRPTTRPATPATLRTPTRSPR